MLFKRLISKKGGNKKRKREREAEGSNKKVTKSNKNSRKIRGIGADFVWSFMTLLTKTFCYVPSG